MPKYAEQIGKHNGPKERKWLKRRQAKLRRRQEKKGFEPKKNRYQGWGD